MSWACSTSPLLPQPVVRHDDQEVDDRRDQDEVDGRGEQHVQVDGLIAADAGSCRMPYVGVAAGADPVDERLDDAVGERGDQRR